MKRIRLFLMVEAELPDETPTELLTVPIVEQVLVEEALKTDGMPLGEGRISELVVLRIEHR